MIQLFLLLTFISNVYADIVMDVYDTPDNLVPINNTIANTLWALSVCSCVGIVCNHKNKNKTPIKVEPCVDYDYNYEKKSYYKIEVNDKDKLSKLKGDLEEMKNVIQTLEDNIDQEEKQKFNVENNIETNIPYWIQFKYGNGIIRIKENGKYYHGMTIHDKQKYNIKDYNHRFFQRLDDKNDPIKWKLGTKDPNEYCCNCSLDNENSKRRKVYNIYQCNWHDDTDDPIKYI